MLLKRVPLLISLSRSYSSSSRKQVVAILGGGISGLSTAYYLVKRYGERVHPIVFESSPRVGGWIKTVTTPGGSRYEIGPRTVRPVGLSGKNTLDLVQELGLDTQVLYVEHNHPTAKNRFVYVNEKLCRLPNDGKVLYKTQEPFSKPLGWALVRDLVKRRKKAEDVSIHDFVDRRFGPEIANYLIDPLIRGICAGDSRDISVKFLMKQLFEHEQKYGSVVLGYLAARWRNSRQSNPPCTLSEDHRTIGFSKIALESPGWAVWTLENGLESLAHTLEERLSFFDVPVKKNTTVNSIRMDKQLSEVEIQFEYANTKSRDTIVCDHVISALGANTLSKILRNSKPSHPDLYSVLDTVSTTDLQVTCLTFTNPELILQNGFGFLVPSTEKSVQGLLGVVFDTNSFPQLEERTVLTVMSRGDQHQPHDLDKIMWYLQKTLGVKESPSEHYTELLKGCIPQYSVGHYEKVDAIKKYLDSAQLPLTLAGSSWSGVSVNDCILSGRDAAIKVGELFFTKK